MHFTDASLDALTERIIAAAITVHRELGPGLLESVYRDCLIIELRADNLHVESERLVPIQYRGQSAGVGFRLDLMVENLVIVEVKSVERLHPVHSAQVITYLKYTGCPAGLLMNFNNTTLRAGLKRLTHPDRYVRRRQTLPIVPTS